MRYLQFGIYLAAIAAGFAARRGKFISGATAVRISWWTGWVIYPAMAFSAVTATFNRESLQAHWGLPVVELGIMLFGALIAWIVIKVYRFSSPQVAGTFGFDLTIGNYVFLPLPLAIFLWGPEAAANIIVASLGAEIAYWTIGVAFLSAGKFARKKLFTPALLALLLGFAEVLWAPRSLHAVVVNLNWVLSKVGALTIPLAMFLLGFHLAGAIRTRWLSREVVMVTLFRGVIVPLAFFFVLPFLPLSPDAKRSLFLVSTMPVAVASVYMSDLFNGDPEYAAKCVMVGHFFSIVSVPLWLALLGY